jgi:hypothetical protein
MADNTELLDTVNVHSFEMRPTFKFKGYYSLLDEEPQKLDAWSGYHKQQGWLSLSLNGNREKTLVVIKALHKAGFDTHMIRACYGTYDVHIVLPTD